MRWVVGDVHGCALEFEGLLESVRFDPGRDELWSLGDLVNRGPDSLAALRLWRDVGGRAVLGNHDRYALLARSGRRPRRKGDTLDRLLGDPRADALLDRLREQPALARLPGPVADRDVWIVHAGLHPAWLDLAAVAGEIDAAPHDDDWLEREDVGFALSVRCCTKKGELVSHTGPPDRCPPPFRPWDTFYRGQRLVVHAHWASRGFHRTGRVIGLDSGCVYGGKLTAWCQEEDRIADVPSRASGLGPRRVDLGAR